MMRNRSGAQSPAEIKNVLRVSALRHLLKGVKKKIPIEPPINKARIDAFIIDLFGYLRVFFTVRFILFFYSGLKKKCISKFFQTIQCIKAKHFVKKMLKGLVLR